jgi:hypothetical protein
MYCSTHHIQHLKVGVRRDEPWRLTMPQRSTAGSKPSISGRLGIASRADLTAQKPKIRLGDTTTSPEHLLLPLHNFCSCLERDLRTVTKAIGALDDTRQLPGTALATNSSTSPWASQQALCVLTFVSRWSANGLLARRRNPYLSRPIPHSRHAHAEPHATSRTPTPTTPGSSRLLRTQEARTRTGAASGTCWTGGDGERQVEQESGGEHPESVHDGLEESTRRGRGQGECACGKNQTADQIRAD